MILNCSILGFSITFSARSTAVDAASRSSIC
jgi:hypothetical protein